MDGIDSRTTAAQNAINTAQTQEREAARRINESQRQVKDAQNDAEVQISHIKQAHDQEEAAESARTQASILREKSRGYEAVRELQTKQQGELTRMRREGEDDLRRLDSHYRGATYTARRSGEQELDELHRTQAQQAEYTKRLGEAEVDAVRARNHDEISRESAEAQHRMQALTETNRAEYDRKAEDSADALAKADAKFRERFANATEEQQGTLDAIYDRAGHKINQVRAETANRLAAYADRQRDPFYKLVELDAAMFDRGEHYELRVVVPPHEQKNISVSLKGENIVVSGYRRNEEKLEIEPGKTRATAAFQSFHETFPVGDPVDAKQLTRRFEGDELVVEVPKKKPYAIAKPYQAPKPERSRVEKPKFPDNIPYVERDVDKDESATHSADPQPSKRTPGSRTLG